MMMLYLLCYPSLFFLSTFYANTKWLNRKLIFDYDHAYDLCFEYIEAFYNTTRIHSHNGYESPNNYEKRFKEQKH